MRLCFTVRLLTATVLFKATTGEIDNVFNKAKVFQGTRSLLNVAMTYFKPFSLLTIER